MVNQDVPNDLDHVWGEHAAVYAAPYDCGTLTHVGVVNDVAIRHNRETKMQKVDSAGDIGAVVPAETYDIGWGLVEIDLGLISILNGGTGVTGDTTGLNNYTEVAGTIVSNHAETVTLGLSPNHSVIIPHRNGDGSLITIVSVKDVTDTTTYTFEDDYTTKVTNGFTELIRNTAGDITDGQSLHLVITYTPNASKQITAGGRTVVNPIKLRIISTKEDGKRLIHDFYMAYTFTGNNFIYPKNESGDYLEIPVSIRAVKDTSRAAGDQLVCILAEE